MARHIDLGGKKVDIIYNGCAPTDLVTATRPHVVPEADFLFTIGTVATKKNFHILPALLTDNDLHLVISGIHQQPAYARRILAEARRLGVSQRVHLTGPITESDKKWYYAQAVACVFPSLAEGFGLPVVEALQSGKPLLLSRHGALPEIGGDLAHYFDQEEPHHLRQQLRKVLQDTSPERALARQARAAKFSWDQAAEAYFRIYQSLV
jgi:glycosyltransferase involved in cell wall biosynthesis